MVLFTIFLLQFTPNFYKNYRDQESNDHNVELGKYIQTLEEKLKAGGGPFFGGAEANAVDYLIWPWFERLETVQTIKPSKCF